MSSKEGLQMNNAGLNAKLRSFINKANGFIVKNWHKCGPIDSHKHFMCTVGNAMELVRGLGQLGWARHRIWLG